MAVTETTVYVYLDADRLPLYVGITGRGHARAEQHAASKPWWGDVVSAQFVHMPTRALALSLEAALIGLVRPLHNVQHRGDGEPVRLSYTFMDDLRSVNSFSSVGKFLRRQRNKVGGTAIEHRRARIDDLCDLHGGPAEYVASLASDKKAGVIRAMRADQFAQVPCIGCGTDRDGDWGRLNQAYCYACRPPRSRPVAPPALSA